MNTRSIGPIGFCANGYVNPSGLRFLFNVEYSSDRFYIRFMEFIPSYLRADILKSFVDKKAYAQVATTNEEGVTSVRTVHIHFLPQKEWFVFNTHGRSQKAKDVLHTRKVSGCFWDDTNQIQYRWIAFAELITEKTHPHEMPLLQGLWKTMREETRLAYVLDHEGLAYDIPELPATISVDERPDTHCLVGFVPHTLDVHRFDPRGYRFGKRTVYVKKNQVWEESPSRLIY